MWVLFSRPDISSLPSYSNKGMLLGNQATSHCIRQAGRVTHRKGERERGEGGRLEAENCAGSIT